MVPLKTVLTLFGGKATVPKKIHGLRKQNSEMPQNSYPTIKETQTTQQDTPSYSNNHPVQAKESGCMITASTTHHIHRNLSLASTHYNKIFTRISGPPCWLSRNLQLAFVPVSLPNDNIYLQYNCKWEIPETPIPQSHRCSHQKLSGRETLCTCSCCHYHCPTHSPHYYGYSQ